MDRIYTTQKLYDVNSNEFEVVVEYTVDSGQINLLSVTSEENQVIEPEDREIVLTKLKKQHKISPEYVDEYVQNGVKRGDFI